MARPSSLPPAPNSLAAKEPLLLSLCTDLLVQIRRTIQTLSLEISEDDIRVQMVGAIGVRACAQRIPCKLCGVNADGVRVREGKLTGLTNILVEAGSGANRIMQYPGAAYLRFGAGRFHDGWKAWEVVWRLTL